MAKISTEELWEKVRQERKDRNKPLEECAWCVGTGYTHTKDCDGESAWDIPEACTCSKPKCRYCRGKKFVDPSVNEKYYEK